MDLLQYLCAKFWMIVMFTIVSKGHFSANVVHLEVEAPLIARSFKPGHFVIVRASDFSERIPLTISAADRERGTIFLVVQRVGVSSARLCDMAEGESLHDVVGPLGKASDIQRFGTVICACGGVGAAPMLPIAQALKQAGNRVLTVLAARSKELIILQDQLRVCSDELLIYTDDGTLGTKGLVTEGVEMLAQREHIDRCVTIGPAVMMKFTALTTARYSIPTIASLNTIMVDGTGMCGACRVSVGGKTRFVCVDGPEFDAALIDWDEMLNRLRSYKTEEHTAYEQYIRQHTSEPLTAKQRMAIPRVSMPELPPAERVKSIKAEVNIGLTREQAVTEAQRCLNCKKPTCVEGCPVGIDIPAFVSLVEQGNIDKAAEVISSASTLPAVCGRVCPQERQCESRCIHLKAGGEAVAIGYLERFVADHAQKTGAPEINKNGTKIAVVGSGPAGLTFAGDMAKLGYEVTVFEALHELGGVLRYGIPEFRLPNAVVEREIDGLRRLGVEFLTNVVIGKTLTIEQLREQGYKAVFVATGAGLPKFMNIEGENLIGVMSSNEYLTRVNLMQAADSESDTPLLHGKRVAVIGGGNTAMDAVRTALRLGAETATIVYRRSEQEMPARREEVLHAKQEGVEFLTLHNPIRYLADDSGRVCAMVLQPMRLGEADASGRRAPEPIEGQTVTRDVDLVIVSVGVNPNPLLPSTVSGLNVSAKGTIEVNESLQSSLPFLFAGGDIVRGGATVILAMSDGRKAAKEMHKYLVENKITNIAGTACIE